MAERPAQKSPELLRVLLEAGVDFVLVGGVAAIAHGSATFTLDMDVVAPLTAENCERILRALGPYSPRFYQTPGSPRVTRTAKELSEFRNLYFDTTLGRIDLLGSLPPIGSYEKVASRAQATDVFGRACKIIHLDDLIEVKAFVGRPKDKMVELELRAIRTRRTGA
jgi:predicted nucleotidyltransferase